MHYLYYVQSTSALLSLLYVPSVHVYLISAFGKWCEYHQWFQHFVFYSHNVPNKTDDSTAAAFSSFFSVKEQRDCLDHRLLPTLKILGRDVFTDRNTRVFTQVLHLLVSATICGDKLRLLALEPLWPFSFFPTSWLVSKSTFPFCRSVSLCHRERRRRSFIASLAWNFVWVIFGGFWTLFSPPSDQNRSEWSRLQCRTTKDGWSL